MRLDKLISNNTSYSRKDTNKLIRKGNVRVNNKLVIDPAFQINESDEVFLFDEIINTKKYHYILLNKPSGFVCSTNDNDGESVFNLIKESYIKDLHIVGRLDKDTTGLVLITNDGEFTHKIKNSKYMIEKEYEVTLENEFTNEMNQTLNQKICLDAKELKPFKINNILNNKLNITLIEGKYHQIKRMFDIVKNPVVSLKRIRIANLKLNEFSIKEGDYIFINKNDLIFNE